MATAAKKIKPQDAYVYYCQFWLNSGTYWQIRVLKVSRLLMTTVEEYMVLYNQSTGIFESCDCPGFTMHRKPKGGEGHSTHKHFQVVKQWLARKRPLFECYQINSSGIVAIQLIPQKNEEPR